MELKLAGGRVFCWARTGLGLAWLTVALVLHAIGLVWRAAVLVLLMMGLLWLTAGLVEFTMGLIWFTAASQWLWFGSERFWFC